VLGKGGGAKSSSKRETLSSDGKESACDKATLGDLSPPEECGALIRIEVVPLASRNLFVGRWSCTNVGTVVAGPERASSSAPSERTITDNGDGTITAVTTIKEGSCAHKFRVSGNTATLSEPATCILPRVVETTRTGELTLGGGTLSASASGTAILDGKINANVSATGTCTKL
jgi:hypothetical protein